MTVATLQLCRLEGCFGCLAKCWLLFCFSLAASVSIFFPALARGVSVSVASQFPVCFFFLFYGDKPHTRRRASLMFVPPFYLFCLVCTSHKYARVLLLAPFVAHILRVVVLCAGAFVTRNSSPCSLCDPLEEGMSCGSHLFPCFVYVLLRGVILCGCGGIPLRFPLFVCLVCNPCCYLHGFIHSRFAYPTF